MENLNGAFGIVTGAAQGLGYAVTLAYVRQGMRVALMDVQSDKLTEVGSELSRSGGDCLAIPVDLSSSQAAQAAVRRAIKHYGTPRVLVHNAAILDMKPLVDVSLREWQRVINVSLQAAFVLTRAVWPLMAKAKRGSVIYVSSRSGVEGFVGESAYCAAKHGLEGLMKSLALEGKPLNIAVNTITPGMYMRTPMSERNYTEELKKRWIDPILLTPAFVFLARQDAFGVTGQRLSAWELSQGVEADLENPQSQ